MEHWGKQNRDWVEEIDTNLTSDVNSLLLNEETENVFVGGIDYILKQFNLRNGELIKQYNNLRVCKIMSLSSFKNILCVGGSNGFFTLINMKSNQVLTTQPIKTSIRQILTCQFCVLKIDKEFKISITVSGSNCLLISHFIMNYL